MASDTAPHQNSHHPGDLGGLAADQNTQAGKKRMQAWQAVKVNNPDSEYSGRAGVVERVERKGDQALVFTRLDATANDDGTEKDPAKVVQFAPEELQILG